MPTGVILSEAIATLSEAKGLFSQVRCFSSPITTWESLCPNASLWDFARLHINKMIGL